MTEGYFPDPPDQDLSALKIQDAGGMLVDAENRQFRREQLFKLDQPWFAHVTKARVMSSSLGVVPVGDHNEVQPEPPQQIQPLHPVKLFAYFVYFVNRESESSQGKGGGTGGDETAAVLDPFINDLRDGGSHPIF